MVSNPELKGSIGLHPAILHAPLELLKEANRKKGLKDLLGTSDQADALKGHGFIRVKLAEKPLRELD
jgi:hypothetical protein